ncbi:MAG: hypothetical protein H8M99_02395 [Gloeobacteraceae cyanobacterium ES-bin-144]|nr:hypothetical protein [Verrucomicrobiales bacterium]
MSPINRAILATSLIGCISANAGNESTPAIDIPSSSSTATGLLLGKFTGESAYDKIWSGFTLYKDDSNQVLQEFSLQGRLQVQYADGNSDNGHFDIENYKYAAGYPQDPPSSQSTADSNDQTVWGDNFEARRARLGFKSKWFQTWKLEGQINVDTTDGFSNLYRDIYDLYLTYAPSDALNVTVGKTKLKFGREQEISSKEILTFERSLVSNLLFPGELTGITVSGKGLYDHWGYELGVYGAQRARGFSSYDEGTVVLGKIAYDYSGQFGLDTAVASFQYMHNSNPGYKTESYDNFYSSSSPSFNNALALTNDITKGRFGLTTDMLYGFGFEGTADQENAAPRDINQDNVFGISVIPSYYIAEGLQLVGRVQWATGGDAEPKNGTTPASSNLGLPSRYERWAPNAIQNGEEYTSFYLGLNYYIYGHKLKLMTGVEYSMMDGGIASTKVDKNPNKNQTASFDGYTFFTGVRMSF